MEHTYILNVSLHVWKMTIIDKALIAILGHGL
jgi:hypothetical protein